MCCRHTEWNRFIIDSSIAISSWKILSNNSLGHCTMPRSNTLTDLGNRTQNQLPFKFVFTHAITRHYTPSHTPSHTQTKKHKQPEKTTSTSSRSTAQRTGSTKRSVMVFEIFGLVSDQVRGRQTRQTNPLARPAKLSRALSCILLTTTNALSPAPIHSIYNSVISIHKYVTHLLLRWPW